MQDGCCLSPLLWQLPLLLQGLLEDRGNCIIIQDKGQAVIRAIGSLPRKPLHWLAFTCEASVRNLSQMLVIGTEATAGECSAGESTHKDLSPYQLQQWLTLPVLQAFEDIDRL